MIPFDPDNETMSFKNNVDKYKMIPFSDKEKYILSTPEAPVDVVTKPVSIEKYREEWTKMNNELNYKVDKLRFECAVANSIILGFILLVCLLWR